MISLSTKVWILRILIVASLVLLCFMAGSGFPALGLGIAWGPNGLFLVAFTRGTLHLPRFLKPVKPIEPTLYHWIGVGLVKRIVATPLWPMVNGFDPTPKLKSSEGFLDRAELSMMGAEVCHGATFILALFIAWFYLAAGRNVEAFWISFFNVVLNAYPVMLQRSNRWRIQQLRAKLYHEKPEGKQAFA